MTTDRNLLFGVFAVMLGKVRPQALADAAARWLDEPQSDLSQRLEDEQLLTPSERHFIHALVDEAIRAHDGDLSAAFEMIGGPDQVYRSFGGRISCSIGPEGIQIQRAIPLGDAGNVLSSGVTESPGRYSLRSEHARGGMGRVLLVHDEHMGRDIALKELLPADAVSTTATTVTARLRRSLPIVARFLQEARITAQLEHPSIVPVYELGHRLDGSVYYTMKLVRGRTFAEAIRKAADLRERLALLPHFVDLCNAIAYAHSRGVIHRDIKPNNVMVGEFGETVVLDWGLAKAKDEADAHEEGMADALRAVNLGDSVDLPKTQYGHALGTPNYMPPEQAAGRLDAIDQRSDVYSLGAMLYELLTGRPPYRGSDARSVILHVLHDKPLPVTALEADAPPELIAIATKAMSKEPEKRFPTAKAFAADIRRFQSGSLVSSYRYSFTDYTRFVWRNYKLQVSAAAAVILMILGFATAYTRNVIVAEQRERELRIETEQANADLRWENYAFAVAAAQRYVERRDYPTAIQVLEDCPVEYRDWEWGFLSRQCDPSVFRLLDSDYDPPGYGNLAKATLSPDGRYLFVHRFFSKLKQIFDIAENKMVYQQQVGDVYGWVRCSQFAPDGLSFTASVDAHSVGRWFWNSDVDEPVLVYDAGDTHLRSLVFSPDGSRVAGYAVTPETGGAELVVWDAATAGLIARYALGTIPGRLEFHPGGEHWGQQLQPIRGQVLGYMPDGETVVIADTYVATLNTTTGDRRDIVPCDLRAAYAPDAGIVAAEDPDSGEIRVVSMEDGTLLCTLPADPVDRYDLAMPRDGSLVAATGGRLQVFAVPSGQLVYDTEHIVSSGSFSDTGNLYLCLESSPAYAQPQFLDFANPSDLGFRRPRDRDDKPLAMNIRSANYGTPVYRYSRDGQWLATAAEDGTVKRWLADDLVLDRSWRAGNEPVNDIDMNADGSRILTAGPEGVVLWNAVTAEPILTIEPREGEHPAGCAFSPDESRIAYAAHFGEKNSDGENLARVYQADTGDLVYEVSSHPGNCNLVAFSPDGQWLFTGAYAAPSVDEPSVYVWDAATGTQLMGTMNALNWPWRIEFSPDGDKALVMSLSIDAAMYDMTTHTELYRKSLGNGRQATFLPGGTRFVVGEPWGFAVHAVNDGRQLIRYDGPIYPVLRGRDPNAIVAMREPGLLVEWYVKPWRKRSRSEEYLEGLETVRKKLGLAP